MPNLSATQKRARAIVACLENKPHTLEELENALNAQGLSNVNIRNLRRDLQQLKTGKVDGIAVSIVCRGKQYHLPEGQAIPSESATYSGIPASWKGHCDFPVPCWSTDAAIRVRIQTIVDAINAQKAVSFNYTKVHDTGRLEYETRTVFPLKMKLWKERPYLFAVPKNQLSTADVRVYAIDQIKGKIEVQRARFNHADLLTTSDLNERLNKVLGVYLPSEKGALPEVRIECKGWAYTDIKHRALHPNQVLTKPNKNGWALLTLPVYHTPEVDQFVAQYREHAQLIE